MAKRRSGRKQTDQEKAIHAAFDRRAGKTAGQRRRTLQTAARRQHVAQKFLKDVGVRGVIANPNTLKKGESVYRLEAQEHAKTLTGREGWVVGKVKEIGKTGKGRLTATVEWANSGRKVSYTAAMFESLSVVQIAPRGRVKKTGDQLKTEEDVRRAQEANRQARMRGLRELFREFDVKTRGGKIAVGPEGPAVILPRAKKRSKRAPKKHK